MTKISNLYALTNQIYVNSSGTAIGIGTTTPSSKLEVAGSVMAHGALTLGSGYALNFYDKGTTAYTWIEGSSYNQSYSFLAFTTGGSEKVRIDSSGNFGIGVAIPSYKLDVNGTARISGAISGTSALFSSSVTATNAIFNGTAAPIRTESTTNNEMQIVRSTTSYGAGFGFYTGSTHNWLLGTAWGETSSNFILYNAATGTQSFKVNYSTNAATFSSSVTVGSGLLSIQGAQQNNLWLNQNAGGTTTGFLLGRSYTSTNSQDFFIYDVAAAAPRFVISSSGNIGIGTTAPTAQLQISSASGGLISINSTTTNSFRGITFQNNAASDSTEYAYIKYNATSGEMRYYANPAAFGGFTTWYSNNTESMRLTSSGNLGVGTTSPTSRLSVIAATGAAAVRIEADSGQNALSIGGTGAFSIDYPGVGGGRFLVRNDGLVAFPRIQDFTTGNSPNTWINPNASFGIYINTSSIRYKKDVINYDKGLDIVNQLRPVYYKGLSEVDGDKQFAGFIAEEIHDLGLTEFVNYLEDGRPNSLSYPNMITLLTKAIQELKAELDTATTRLQLLENK